MYPQIEVRQLPTGYFERIVQETLTGLKVLVRDVNLGEEAVAAYQPGRILHERAFVEASSNCHGRPATTHRITILSNAMTAVDDIDDDPEASAWGMHVSRRDAYFKVLDVCQCGEKMQVLLLHLPYSDNWRLFEGVALEKERELAEFARVQFKHACRASVDLVMATDRWLARCAWPIGLTNDGSPQELDELLEQRLRPLVELDFRDVVGSMLFVEGVRDLLGLEPEEYVPEEFDSCLAYGYLDEAKGLSLRVLGSACLAEGCVVVAHNLDDVDVTLRFEVFKTERAAVVVDAHLCEFARRIEEIDRAYPALPEGMDEVRSLREIDHLRFGTFPDDIQVLLISEGRSREAVWVRLRALVRGRLRGTLLNEPAQEFGVHAGDSLEVEMRQGREGVVCLAML